MISKNKIRYLKKNRENNWERRNLNLDSAKFKGNKSSYSEMPDSAIFPNIIIYNRMKERYRIYRK